MIRVGPAGWSYADWEGSVYPRTKPRGFHPLPHLARFVDVIELNGTFYGMPQAEHAARWVQLVRDRDRFRFTAKLHRSFTHEELPEDARLERLAASFLDGIAPLRASGKLAGLLAQFPHSFRWSERARGRLARLARLFAAERPILEVRHRSFYEPDVLRALADDGWSLARLDLPFAHDHPPADAPTFGPLGYLRLHGRNRAAWFDGKAGRDQRYDYLYDPHEIHELAAVARRLAQGHDETYVITNNHFSGKAVANALELSAELGDERPFAPPELVRAYPRLTNVTRPLGQGSLFTS